VPSSTPLTDADPVERHRLFWELHSRRLYAFALLVALGDTGAAGNATTDAFREAWPELEHLDVPESAAAWLRRRALRSLRRAARSHRGRADELPDSLVRLGVDTTTFRALFKLSLTERAALVAGDVERLRPADIDEVLGSEPGHGVATLERARTRYAAAYAAAAGGADPRSERQGRRLTALRDASRAALGATAMAGR
jgi:DNA-directed RNA polymerase specialized sigma24 family protein